MRLNITVLLFFLTTYGLAQTGTGIVTGTISGTDGNTIEGASIQAELLQKGTVSNLNGAYSLILPAGRSILLQFRHIGYENFQDTVYLKNDESLTLNVTLKQATEVLPGVEIEDYREIREEVSVTRIQPKSAEALVTPFGDFNKILTTLPGVISNNELSSTYSVRGGSFDENLVYVNDIPIYRPFLVSSGQQEGLSFINTNLVEEVAFSAGGWQPKYGDKLSSVLNVNYKNPTAFAASANIHLLGGGAHIEGTSGDEKISYVAGFRHKSSQYLLNTLETQGEYLPKFTDLQAYVNFKLSKKTTLGVLASYARNRYLTEPVSRETEFGTFNRSFRLFVGFIGREILEYDTYQGGLKLTHQLNNKWTTNLIVSGVYALEREYTDVEGGYRLCDVDKNLDSNTFNECIFIRGIGTNYDYGRNTLDVNIVNVESRNTYEINEKNKLEFGLGYSYQNIEDQLNEYTFLDSSDYVIDIQSLASKNELTSDQYTGYIQQTSYLSDRISTTYGVRFNYWTINKEFLISPRAQISFRPKWERDIVFNAAVGVYQQPPFYRELRDYEGNLNLDLKAQKSVHLIAGMDYNFQWWERDFKFISEVYYKSIRDVVPYDIDNIKVRYYANNNAKAYAAGLDMRISGEFIPGTESWFSLGVLNVREDVDGDNRGYIRRPTDQRVTLAIFFQDHLPNNPTVRVSMNLLFGSGLPFGPPQSFNNRNVFNGDSYKRLDIGFSKLFYLNREKYKKQHQLVLSAEILNLLNTSNAISYTWISDVNNNQFAVPNTLSARFLNIKLSIKI